MLLDILAAALPYLPVLTAVGCAYALGYGRGQRDTEDAAFRAGWQAHTRAVQYGLDPLELPGEAEVSEIPTAERQVYEEA